MDFPKTVPGVNLVGGVFIDKGPGQAGSLIPAVWGTAVTQEILAVLAEAGITPVENTNNQLVASLLQIISIRSAALAAVNVFAKAQRGAVINITPGSGSAVDMDMTAGNFYSLSLAGNRTMNAPSNIVAGQSGYIFISQDATGGRTLSFNSAFKFEGGQAPTIGTTPNAVNVLGFLVKSATEIECVMRSSFS